MNGGALVIAYHGCDVTVRDDLVSGRVSTLKPSNNDYDWLGPGAYFYEGDADRALLFAQASHKHPERLYTARPIATPAVVGAVLSISRCLDMTTQEGLRQFLEGYQTMSAGVARMGAAMPVNEAASDDDLEIIRRKLDAAVFASIHAMRGYGPQPLPAYQLVRAAFHQGPAAAPSSAFRLGTHIQLAVCDPSTILAWFLPLGQALLPPDQLASARAALDAASRLRTARKPRMKAARPH